jgi:membrane protease YdiL (CAAX protease family)
LLYLLAIFAGGALLAPALHTLAQWGAEQSPALQSLAEKPFRHYVSRSFLVIALAGLWPFLRGLGIRRWRDAGLGPPKGEGSRLAAGFGLGLVSLAVVALVAVGTGARAFEGEHSPAAWLRHVANAGFAAVVVAFLEELLFRGALFGALRRSSGFVLALVVSSSIYALVHFLDRAASPPVVNWSAGFAVLGAMLRGFTEVQALVPGFFNLTLAGCALALAYERTGSLYFSIGLHAGWIWWLKTYGFLTRPVPGASDWLWGTNKMIDGWVALPVLATVCLLVARWPRTVALPAPAPGKGSETTGGHG